MTKAESWTLIDEIHRQCDTMLYSEYSIMQQNCGTLMKRVNYINEDHRYLYLTLHKTNVFLDD